MTLGPALPTSHAIQTLLVRTAATCAEQVPYRCQWKPGLHGFGLLLKAPGLGASPAIGLLQSALQILDAIQTTWVMQFPHLHCQVTSFMGTGSGPKSVGNILLRGCHRGVPAVPKFVQQYTPALASHSFGTASGPMLGSCQIPNLRQHLDIGPGWQVVATDRGYWKRLEVPHSGSVLLEIPQALHLPL